LHSKPAISANFSFLNILLDNDTDSNLYKFFETLRFSSFSMRSSTNNFSFKWKNKKDDSSDFHTIYASQSFDVFDNNISGEFPCHFKSVPVAFYIDHNFITSTDITCYQSKNFETMMIFQKEIAYKNASECYPDFTRYAFQTDYNPYCNFVQSEQAPLALQECCTNIPLPTLQPTQEPKEMNVKNGAQWFLDNIEWFIILLIVSFAFIVYIIWRRKTTKTSKKEQMPLIPQQPKVSAADKESLLYGDF